MKSTEDKICLNLSRSQQRRIEQLHKQHDQLHFLLASLTFIMRLQKLLLWMNRGLDEDDLLFHLKTPW